MKETPYVALLRGINVGGNNLIKMTALKDCFEKQGFADVRTYIQSGNVLFKSAEKNLLKLTERIQKALLEEFGSTTRVLVLSHDALSRGVKGAPEGFGTEPEKYRYDVIFLLPPARTYRGSFGTGGPVTAKKAIQEIKTKEGVDMATAGKGVLYFSRLIAKASHSHLARVIKLPIYKSMTIRNWNTTTKLLALMEERAGA